MTGGRWKAGQSGNPRGRAKGAGDVARLRAQIALHVPDIIAKQVELAKAGDSQAARLLLERVLPPVRAAEQPAPIKMPAEGLAAQGRAVMAAAGAGELAPGQAAQLLTGLAAMAKLIETDEHEARLAALEEQSQREEGS